MRFLLRAKIPSEAGNQMVQDPIPLKKLEQYINKAKSEATYFYEADGNRTVDFIVDIDSAEQIPILLRSPCGTNKSAAIPTQNGNRYYSHPQF
jgi:hypothetical protein